jgi:ATPase family AAA domain-containing protein 1
MRTVRGLQSPSSRRVLLVLSLIHLASFPAATTVHAAPFFLPRRAWLRSVTRILHDWKEEIDASNDDDDAEEEPVTTLGSVLLSSLSPPSPFWHRSLLWGLFLYGLLEVGKLIALSVEELQQKLHATATDASSSPSVYGGHPELVAAVLHYGQRHALGDATTSLEEEEKYEDPRFRSACALAQLLRSTGIPWQSSSERSVETLLNRLTAPEIRFLQQSLHVPPVPTKNAPRPLLMGLSHTRQQLLDTIRHRLGPPPDDNDQNQATTPVDPFAAVFATSDPSNHHLGILLYGPPGCGKTLLIRSLAAELQLPCLILTPSLLLHKYLGETNAHVRLLFTLLQDKLAPCILCLDELDGLFRERQADHHEVMGELLTEFLQWMDGLMTPPNHKPPIVFLGATNRPFDVDPAVLRRLPHAHAIGLPDAKARGAWFTAALSALPHTLTAAQCATLVAASSKYTYSDLRTWLQAAVRAGPRRRGDGPLTYDDWCAVRTAPTAGGSARYQARLAEFAAPHGTPPRSEEGGVWQTAWGNYYHLGTLPVDGPTMDLLQQVAQELQKDREEEEEEEE